VPVIGLIQVGEQAMADRYTYLTQIGLYILLAWAVADFFYRPGWRQWLCYVGSALVLAILMFCAFRQTSYWHDRETLWTHALACTSGNRLAHLNMGAALRARGKVEEAIEHYEKALEISPHWATAHYNLGNALLLRGRVVAAIAHYKEALKANPRLAEAYQNSGIILVRSGAVEDGVAQWREGVVQCPQDVALINLTARILATHPDPRIRRGSEAVELAERAVRLSQASDPRVLDTLSAAYAEVGRFSMAQTAAEQALALATAERNRALIDSLRARIKLYQSSSAYRESWTPAAHGT